MAAEAGKPGHLFCPRCKRLSASAVLDSRPSGDEIRRRRKCDGCGERFTTYEKIVPLAQYWRTMERHGIGLKPLKHTQAAWVDPVL